MSGKKRDLGKQKNEAKKEEKDLRLEIDELARLMEEFKLDEAQLSGEQWHIQFSRTPRFSEHVEEYSELSAREELKSKRVSSGQKIRKAQKVSRSFVEAPQGAPVSSPIAGIFYHSPSPSDPNFVSKGDTIEEGQVIGLVEAMKVFNEVLAPKAGIASAYVAKNAELVHAGDVLLYIE